MAHYQDQIYNALCVFIALALCYCLAKSLSVMRSRPNETSRRQAQGIAPAALGTLIALTSGLIADALLKRSHLFQQVRFSGYYLGFALITAGMIAVVNAGQPATGLTGGVSRSRSLRIVMWAAFLLPLAIAAVYLLDRHTFITNVYDVQVQRKIYWAPMLATTISGAAALFLSAWQRRTMRDFAIAAWMAVFALLIFVGLLRESLIVPDLGDPLANLLAAFGPFALAGICLSLAASILENESLASVRRPAIAPDNGPASSA